MTKIKLCPSHAALKYIFFFILRDVGANCSSCLSNILGYSQPTYVTGYCNCLSYNILFSKSFSNQLLQMTIATARATLDISKDYTTLKTQWGLRNFKTFLNNIEWQIDHGIQNNNSSKNSCLNSTKAFLNDIKKNQTTKWVKYVNNVIIDHLNINSFRNNFVCAEKIIQVFEFFLVSESI